MTRRERTTGLPRPQRRERAPHGWRFAGITWDDRRQHIVIIGAVVALLLLVVALIAYRIYDDRYGRPNSVIISVGGTEITLGYYADRLVQFIQANPDGGAALGEQALLNKLEEEELSNQLAQDKGIVISEQDITDAIARELGVPVAGPGSSFDLQYRQKLKTAKMSDVNYRRLKRAELAQQKLQAFFGNENGGVTEELTFRTVITQTKEEAEAVLVRIKSGEDMGSIAQTISTDLQARSKDGLMAPEPPILLPPNLKAAVEGKVEGDILGPVEVGGSYWIARLEKRDPQGLLTDAQRTQVGKLKLVEALKAKRSSVKVTRSVTASDFRWAETHAN